MKPIEKVKITPTLKDYYANVRKWCRENDIPFKTISPIGLTVDIRNIPENKVEEWINIVKQEKL